MSEYKKLNDDFIITFLQNGIVAVCENLEESVYAWKKGASAILLVKERGGEYDDVFVMADEDLIKEVLDSVDIPVFVRVKYGHFGEAKICEELGVDGIVEGFQSENSLEKKLDINKFDFPIISEVFNPEKISKSNKNILFLGDYATGNFNSIREKFLKVESLSSGAVAKDLEGKKIFLGGGISSVADLDVLEGIWDINGFFVGSAIFDLEHREFFEDYWDYKKNIFI